ncbi:MAG: MFS transporter [Pseudorhodoplanes sp.]
MSPSSSSRASDWRTPGLVIFSACVIALLAFGPRSSLGFFLQPMSLEKGWGRDIFAFAFAIQNLLWGAAQPFAGAMADRFGAPIVICVGTSLYAAGLALMGYANSPHMLDLTIGGLIGFGLSGCSFNLVVSSLGKLVPENMRPFAFGAGTAAGSFGQFLFSPLAVYLIGSYGWHTALLVFAGLLMLILPMSLMLSTGKTAATASAPAQSLKSALVEAFSHRSYVLLVLGFFTCGFQLAFVTVHLPSYLVDRGLDVKIGGWVLAVIGLFNIVGSLGSGWLSSRMPMRYILAGIYFTRAIAVVLFVSLPMSPASALAFGMVTGLMWLSTVPPTSGLVLRMFGTRWLAMLFGFAFFSHQVGGFLGVWLGGLAFERTGSYDAVWWLAVLFGLLSAIINLPIVEKPVVRASTATA